MMAIRDPDTHAQWVRVDVDGRAHDVAFRAGEPVSVRLVFADGTTGPWWLLSSLTPGAPYARAAEAAVAFVAQFRGIAG